MRRTIVTSEIQVIGRIWLSDIMAAQIIQLTDYDIDNMWNGEFTALEDAITRDDIAEWLNTQAGDFQEIIDFRADISQGEEDLVIEWKYKDSELAFNDSQFASED